jgi:hypothetical protein
MTKLKRTIYALIAAYGGSNPRVTTGKHHKFRFQTPSGRTALVVVSASASDSLRAIKNTESLIKKALRP